MTDIDQIKAQMIAPLDQAIRALAEVLEANPTLLILLPKTIGHATADAPDEIVGLMCRLALIGLAIVVQTVQVEEKT